jgi:hypothetical protein
MGNTDPNQDFTPVFLAHARLFAFAERYRILSLKSLVLQKLHQTLVRFEIHAGRISDIVELVRYAYSKEYDSGIDPMKVLDAEELRVLVTMYVASKYSDLQGSKEFEALLEDGGPFVPYLLRLLDHS